MTSYDVAPAKAPVAGRPMVYAGRFADRLDPSGLPDCEVVDEWEVLPARLAAGLEGASVLVVLDLLSFPLETMAEAAWGVPIVVLPSPELDVDALEPVFGPKLFDRLGFFDRLATSDDELWEGLKLRRLWAEGQRLVLSEDRPGAAVAEVLSWLAAEPETPNVLDDADEEGRYWGERGVVGDDPGAGTVHRRLAFGKAVHRAQATALEPQFIAARGERASGVAFDVLEVGAGEGRWVPSFDSLEARFVGAEADEGVLEAARRNFSVRADRRFDLVGRDLRLPYEDESFDLVFEASTMRRLPAARRWDLVREMWRVAKPGGRVTVLEQFVAGGGAGVHTTSVMEFVDLLVDATAGRTTLEHVQSLRYPHEALVKNGLISVSKLAVPQAW